MLSKPNAGWTDITIGDIMIGTASYIEDIPVNVLNAFIEYFNEDNCLNFSIEFDAEGYFFGLVEFNGELFVINNQTGEKIPNMTKVSTDALRKILGKLAVEVIQNIQENMMSWVLWDFDDLEYKNDKKVEERKNLLNKKCDLLASQLREKEK